MENFAVLCPELAFKIEYYADAAAYQGSGWHRVRTAVLLYWKS